MTNLFAEAARLQSLLEEEERDFYFVGGIALQVWGEPRLTTDIDLTIFTNLVNETEQIEHFASLFRTRKEAEPDPIEFARVNRVLLLETESTTGIDLMLSGLADMSDELSRSSYQQFTPDISLKVCSADTLIAYKTVAGRLKDLADIESVVTKQRSLDWDYIFAYLDIASEYKDISASLNTLRFLRDKYQHP